MDEDPISPPILRDSWDLGSVLLDIWKSGAHTSDSALPPSISTNWPWFPISEGSPHYTHRSTPTHADEFDHRVLPPEADLAAPKDTMYMSSSYGSPASPKTEAYDTSTDNAHGAFHGEAAMEVECKSGGSAEIKRRRQQRKDMDSKQVRMQQASAEEVQLTKQKGGEEVILKVYGKGEKDKEMRKMDMKAVTAAWKSVREKEESVTKRLIARRRRIRRLMEDAYWALQIYALLQGVLYAAVASGEILSCQHFWPVAALTITITFTTITIIVTRLHTVEKEQPKADDEEDFRRHLVAAANNLLFQPIDDVFSSLPENPLTSDSPPDVDYHIFRFPANGFVVLFLLIGFFFVIFVSCSIMLCYKCPCSGAD